MKINIAKFFVLAIALVVLTMPFVAVAQTGTICVDNVAPPKNGVCTPARTAIDNYCVNNSGIVVDVAQSELTNGQTVYSCAPGTTLVKKGTKYTPTSKPPIPDPKPGGGNPGTPPTPIACSGGTTSGGLCIPENPACVGGNSNSIACGGSADIVGLLAKVISTLLFFAGIVAVVFIIIGGYRYMTSAGSEEGAKKGRATLTNALIGLVIVILAYAIVLAVTNFLTK